MRAVISEDVKIEIRNQTDPIWDGSSCSVSRRKWKNGKIEEWKRASKNGKIERLKYGNRNHGALKALIQSAQGSALGHGTPPAISAPCKGSYFDIERLKYGK
jgi:hypothetical protein